MTKTLNTALMTLLIFTSALTVTAADNFPRGVSVSTVDGSWFGIQNGSFPANQSHRDVPFFSADLGADDEEEQPQDDPWGFLILFKPGR